MSQIFSKKLMLCVFLLQIGHLFAQDFNYTFKEYNWEETTQYPTEIVNKYTQEQEVILNKIFKVEIVVEGDKAVQYRLMHEQKLINSDEAIERNNRIYIPFNQTERLVNKKARVILKNGQIITLDEKDIMEEIDQERDLKYNYFAVKGIEKGAIIENFFIIEEAIDIKGNTIKVQQEYPIANYDFSLIFPDYLQFKTKSYNNLSEPQLDSIAGANKSVLKIIEKDITALKDDEKYANRDVNLKLFRYKLDANLNNRAKNMNNYKDFGNRAYDRINAELDKKDVKAIETFCKNIPTSTDPQEQIWNIENKIKTTIVYNKYADYYNTLKEVVDSKQANSVDLLRLYAAVLRNFNIEKHIVFTSDRYQIPFDKDFESYENLDDILIYFPSIDKYLAPTALDYRLPLFPNENGNNYGLFIKETTFSGIKMGISEINFIKLPGTEISHDYMDITIDFTKDIENPVITSKLKFGGYSALNFQTIKDYVPDDKYNEILKNIAENYSSQTEYTSIETANDGVEFVGKKPFEINMVFSGKDLIQKAANNYLFSVGKIIGQQVEMYQAEKRVLPIEIDYPHYYSRNITIKLPENVKVKNLETINLNFETKVNNKTEAKFISTYKQNSTDIVIENTEFYNIINYPIDKFDDYKAVINAAADFNKIVLVLTK
jgi:hypothetical protein